MYTGLGREACGVSRYAGLGQVPDISAVGDPSYLAFLQKQIPQYWQQGVYTSDPRFILAVGEGWVPSTVEGAISFAYWTGRFGVVTGLKELVAREYWGWFALEILARATKMAPAEWDRWIVTLTDNYAPQGGATPAQRDLILAEARRLVKLWPGAVAAPLPAPAPAPTPIAMTGPGGAPFGFLPPGYNSLIPALGDPLNPGAGYYFKGTPQINLVDPSVPGVEKVQSWDLWWNPTTNVWKLVAHYPAQRFGMGATLNPVPSNWSQLSHFEDLSYEAPVGTVRSPSAKLLASYTGGAVVAPAPVTPITRPPLVLTAGQVTTPTGTPLTPAEIEQAFPGFTAQVQAQVQAAQQQAVSSGVPTTIQVTTPTGGTVGVTASPSGQVQVATGKIPVGLLVAAGAGLLFFLGKRRRR